MQHLCSLGFRCQPHREKFRRLPSGATPTALRSVLPAFFVAKLSTLDEEQELGDAAPEGDPTGNTVPFASEESAEAGQASDELEHGPVGGRPALGVLR